jgi:hypothetical protein
VNLDHLGTPLRSMARVQGKASNRVYRLDTAAQPRTTVALAILGIEDATSAGSEGAFARRGPG